MSDLSAMSLENRELKLSDELSCLLAVHVEVIVSQGFTEILWTDEGMQRRRSNECAL